MINYKIFDTKQATAKALADELRKLLIERNGIKTTIAISGGSTPFIMFEELAKHTQINWQNVHFFWVDERCVPPISDESNYKNTVAALFSRINIPQKNIHRVLGENEPKQEAERYSQEIVKFVNLKHHKTTFDIVLLGMGDDGHTASIFPPQLDLMASEKYVEVGQNPYNKQKRITLTGQVINNANKVFFLVTGAAKAKILKQIVRQETGYLQYPAAHISTKVEQTIWYLDKEAVTF